MTLPASAKLTPNATYTLSEGYSATASTEFWQQLKAGSNLFVVYEGVPNDLAQNIMQSADPDTAIKLQLAAYPRRIATG